MARKPRPDPFSEGSLTELYRLFFGKLILFKPDAYSIQDWLEHLFDSANRDIIRFVAKRPFLMPGLLRTAPNVKVQGLGYRQVKAGDELWVRLDARHPDAVDVEYFGGQGQKDQIFALNREQWHFVRLHCEDAERPQK